MATSCPISRWCWCVALVVPTKTGARDRPRVVVLGPSGAALGRHLCDLLPGAQLHGPRAYPDAWDETYERATEHLAALFSDGRAILGLCASGMLIRALAPL